MNDLESISGTNLVGEFSGWHEGLLSAKSNEFDIIIFANDTFCTRREFGENEINKLTESVEFINKYNKSVLIGELCWSIDYNRFLMGKKFLLKWIRTSMFVMTKSSIKSIDYFKPPQNINDKVKMNRDNNRIVFSNDIPKIIQNRINNWLFPTNPNEGWYKSQKSDASVILLKAKCILLELMLTINSENEGIKIIDASSKITYKKYLFKALYKFQKILKY